MIKESRVQKYLREKKSKPQNSDVESEQVSPLPTEDLLAIFQKLKGRDGKTPKEKELLDLIIPLIPKAKDGHTPTRMELLALIAPLIPKVKDGMTPEKGKHYFTKEDVAEFLEKATPIKGKHYFDGKDGKRGRPGKDAILPSLYELAVNAINVLESFEGDDRLDVKAIKNIDKLIKKIASEEFYRFGGPGAILHDGTLTGDGVTQPLKVVGGGASFETPSGAIDGINTDFVVLNTPKAVLLNGATYFENDGYTFNSITKTVSMLITPVVGSTLRSLY